MAERLSWLTDIWTAAIVGGGGSIVGGGMWAVRRIFTNQQQIDVILENEKTRDVIRQQDRDAVKEIHKDVRELRTEISEWRK